MDRRKILLRITGLLLLVGFVFASLPFFISMNPNNHAKANARVTVKMTDIPDEGALVVDYGWYRALVVKNPEIVAFLMPYDGYYFLPDPTWKRAIIRCKNFVISSDEFFCDDDYFRQQARWDFQGKNKGDWMPDLKRADFMIYGKYMVISPEYN